jgi:hypothetical protein
MNFGQMGCTSVVPQTTSDNMWSIQAGLDVSASLSPTAAASGHWHFLSKPRPFISHEPNSPGPNGYQLALPFLRWARQECKSKADGHEARTDRPDDLLSPLCSAMRVPARE